MSKSTGNPLMDRFEGLDNVQTLRSRVILPAQPVNLHDGMEEYEVVAVTRNAFLNYYDPPQADIKMMNDLVVCAKAYCAQQYPTLQEFARRIYEEPSEREPVFVPPFCLSGPPGTGKTALVGAIQRLFNVDRFVDLGAGHDRFPLDGSWIINVKNKTSIAAALRAKIPPDIKLSKIASIEQLTRLCTMIAYRKGACVLVLDELQDALQKNGKPNFIADTVKGIGYLGLPYMFVANYNLCQIWLDKLPRQDQQRIFSKTVVLQPSASDSEDWLEYLRGVARILGATSEIDIEEKRHLLFHYTAGNKRFMIELLLGSLGAAWRQGRRVIHMRDVERYYDSTYYSIYRDDVEQANSSFAGRRKRPIDYDCPFKLPKVTSAAVAELEKKAAAKRDNVILLREAMTRSEKDAQTRNEPKPKAAEPVPLVPPTHRKRTTSPEELMRGFQESDAKRQKTGHY